MSKKIDAAIRQVTDILEIIVGDTTFTPEQTLEILEGVTDHIDATKEAIESDIERAKK